jgi:hypothetical protein
LFFHVTILPQAYLLLQLCVLLLGIGWRILDVSIASIPIIFETILYFRVRNHISRSGRSTVHIYMLLPTFFLQIFNYFAIHGHNLIEFGNALIFQIRVVNMTLRPRNHIISCLCIHAKALIKLLNLSWPHISLVIIAFKFMILMRLNSQRII